MGNYQINPGKSLGIAYLFWIFTGIFGGHRFYLGYYWTGILCIFTGGVMWLIDLAYLPKLHAGVNRGYGGRLPYHSAPHFYK